MTPQRLARLYLPPTLALTALTGAPIAAASWNEPPDQAPLAAAGSADAGADASDDAGDGGDDTVKSTCGPHGDLGPGTLVGAGCC